MYGQNDSWTLGYNLFADVWLNTSLVEPSVGILECSSIVVPDEFQVYDGHSNYIDLLMLSSDFGYFGMPSDNLSSTVAVSSWYFHKFSSSVVLTFSRLEFICSCYDYRSRPELGAYQEG